MTIPEEETPPKKIPKPITLRALLFTMVYPLLMKKLAKDTSIQKKKKFVDDLEVNIRNHYLVNCLDKGHVCIYIR